MIFILKQHSHHAISEELERAAAPTYSALSLRLPPFQEAALQGWRRIRDRRTENDWSWARLALLTAWCFRTVPNAVDAIIEDVAAKFAGHSFLDRDRATIVCTRVCTAARLADAIGRSNERMCGKGLCICSGGLSANLDQPVAHDVPSASFDASQVFPLSTATARHIFSGRLFESVVSYARMSVTSTGGAGMTGDALRVARQYESAYFKGRVMLASSAVNRSIAFTRYLDERCEIGPLDKAFKLTLRAPSRPFEQAEITITANPSLLQVIAPARCPPQLVSSRLRQFCCCGECDVL